MQAAQQQQDWDAEIYSAAIRYLERGWSIIPVGASLKVPCIEWKRFQTERASDDDVEEWFRSFSGFNLGLVTGAVSGIVIVDADTPEAMEFCKARGLTSPIRVRTRKGCHYYWRHPGGGLRFANVTHNAITGRGLMGCPHLDFKGDGGYAVVPPSVARRPDGDFAYRWELEVDWEDMPVWRGTPSLADVTDADPDTFDFGALNLENVRGPSDMLPVRERVAKRVQELGRRIGEGDGRNQALIQYAGEQVRRGVLGEELERVCQQFQEDFFLDRLDEKEFTQTIRSAMQMDMRNHPADYRADGVRLDLPKAAPAAPAVKIGRLLTAKDIPALKAQAATVPWLCDPWLRRGSISQVFGYTGHGKSIFVLGACWHLALPKTDHHFGPFDIPGPCKTAYFDWENSRNTLLERMELFQSSYGDPGDNLQIWSQSVLARETGPIHLLSQNGIQTFRAFVEQTQPDIVVIDTIRSAYEGMKENDADSWAVFNRTVTNLRNEGRTVIALHHANKPGENGHGTEAGSTNQLTAIEVQMRVTQLYADEEVAHSKKGKHAPELLVKLQQNMELIAAAQGRTDPRIVSAIEITYGKNREANENSITRAMAFCEDDGGRQFIAHQSSPKQAARAMAARGHSVDLIADKFRAEGHHISKRSIRAWVERRAD